MLSSKHFLNRYDFSHLGESIRTIHWGDCRHGSRAATSLISIALFSTGTSVAGRVLTVYFTLRSLVVVSFV